MKKILLTISLLMVLTTYAQEKQNIILYPEASLGVFLYKNQASISGSLSLYYQHQQNLFSIRRRILTSVSDPINKYELILRESHENSMMYGRRIINNRFSYSFSAGISKTYSQVYDEQVKKNVEISYFGFPLEFNIKWFKPKKAKIYLLGQIPLGEKTSLSFSSGFKLFANISEKSYFGISYTVGFGNYKKYK